MEIKKLWYAVMTDNDDTDHSLGSDSREIAIEAAKVLRKEGYKDAYVAVVDPVDDFCLVEIRDF